MSENEPQGALDRAVRLLARMMNAAGLNGTRLLWRWNRRRSRLGESGMKTEIAWRSARGKHKMCPSCRALVLRSSDRCPDCGASLSAVSRPGVGRLLTNLLPGITAVTSLIMLVNGFWFVMMIMAQIKAGGGSVSPFGGFDVEMIVRFGAGMSRERILSTEQVVGGEWWRLITPIFLHSGLLHFFFNSYLLLNLGPIVEEIYGSARYWVIYLCCGIAGCMASQFPRFVITVGASGAIMGLIGLLLVYGYRSGGLLGQSMKTLVLRLGLYTIVLSIFFNIDHLNHLGGLACGALLALIVPSARRSEQGRYSWQFLALVGVLLVIFAFYQVARQGRLGVGS